MNSTTRMNINPLIHIGFHKTGTSWLQDELFHQNSKYFHSISSLAPHFVYDEQNYFLNSFDKNEKVIRQKIVAELEENPLDNDKIPVISYERLSGSPFAGGVNANSNAMRIKNIFTEAKILIVIRNQSDAILSAYFQYLTGGGTHGLVKFLNAVYNGLRPHFTKNHYHYHYIIEGYQSLFGKKNVLVLPFELFRDNKGEYLQKIGNFVDQAIDVDAIDTAVFRNKNEHQFVRYKCRFLSKFIKSTELNDFPKRQNALAKKVAWNVLKILKLLCPKKLNRQIKLRLLQKVKNLTHEEFMSSNRKTEELTGLDLSVYGYQLPKSNN